MYKETHNPFPPTQTRCLCWFRIGSTCKPSKNWLVTMEPHRYVTVQTVNISDLKATLVLLGILGRLVFSFIFGLNRLDTTLQGRAVGVGGWGIRGA